MSFMPGSDTLTAGRFGPAGPAACEASIGGNVCTSRYSRETLLASFALFLRDQRKHEVKHSKCAHALANPSSVPKPSTEYTALVLFTLRLTSSDSGAYCDSAEGASTA